jgi:signal transduction histidine kinase
LEALSGATIAWSQGDFSARVEESTGDEFGQLAGRLNDMARQLAHLLETRRELAVIDERNRLARELHDSAKQLAFAAAAQIGGVRTLIQRDPAAAKEHLAESERLLDNLRRELTGMILELRPPALVGEGLDTAVRSYLTEWASQNDIETKLHFQDVPSLPLETEQSLFRILQESLANVARHSGADKVTVTLVYSAENILLTISDNGRGFNPDRPPDGFGLTSMQQRTEALGGRLTVQSAAGKGTTITCTVPTEMSKKAMSNE